MQLGSTWENLPLSVGQHMGESSAWSSPGYGRHFFLQLGSTWENLVLAVGPYKGESSSWSLAGYENFFSL